MKATVLPHPGPSDLVCPQLAPPTPATVAPQPTQRKSGAAAIMPDQLQRLEWLRRTRVDSTSSTQAMVPRGCSQDGGEEYPPGLDNAGFLSEDCPQPVRTVSARVAERASGRGAEAKRREAEGSERTPEEPGRKEATEAPPACRGSSGKGGTVSRRAQKKLEKRTVDKLSWKVSATSMNSSFRCQYRIRCLHQRIPYLFLNHGQSYLLDAAAVPVAVSHASRSACL